MTENGIASALEVQNIIIGSSAEFEDMEVLANPAMKADRKWHYLNRNLWPICHADEFFELSLPQVFVPMSR